MKNIRLFLCLVALGCQVSATMGETRSPVKEDPVPPIIAKGEKWVDVPGKSFGLVKNGRLLWQINVDGKEGKPYLHPLRTVSGYDLTWYRPEDHPWHLGLWFSWKLINGVNYWETDRVTGLCQGITAIKDFKVTKAIKDSVRFSMVLEYHPPEEPVLLTEARTITVSAPREDGSYFMDWHAVFTAGETAVFLDRTKPSSQGGPAWGGYAGLAYRSAKDMTEREVRDSTGWKNTGKIMGSGKPADWIDLSGRMNGGEAFAGVTIMDHPQSWRHSTPWYVYLNQTFGAIKSAPIYHEPMTLAPHEKLTLFYRILVHEGRANPDWLMSEYEQFSRVKAP